MAVTEEQVFVEAFVPQPAVEAFDQAILLRYGMAIRESITRPSGGVGFCSD